MAIYEYQGEKFELKDGLSQQEAEVKIKSFLNEGAQKQLEMVSAMIEQTSEIMSDDDDTGRKSEE